MHAMRQSAACDAIARNWMIHQDIPGLLKNAIACRML
jgi:hypothetical protein